METWKKVTIGAAGGVLLIVGVVFGVSWWSSRAALAALDEPNPTPEQIRSITNLMASEDGNVLLRVDQKLTELGEKAIPALDAKAKDTGASAGVRVHAAELIKEIKPEAALATLAVLIDPATTQNPGIREKSVGLLKGELVETEQGRALAEKAAQDPSPLVQRVAAETLPPSKSERALKMLMQSEDARAARHAKRQLEERRRSRRR